MQGCTCVLCHCRGTERERSQVAQQNSSIFRALFCRVHRVDIAHLRSQQLHHFDAVLEGSKPQGCAVESEGERGCGVGVGGDVCVCV